MKKKIKVVNKMNITEVFFSVGHNWDIKEISYISNICY